METLKVNLFPELESVSLTFNVKSVFYPVFFWRLMIFFAIPDRTFLVDIKRFNFFANIYKHWCKEEKKLQQKFIF